VKIYKATFYNNCGHSIEKLECESITKDAVSCVRTAREVSLYKSNANIIYQRETKSSRYCVDLDEVVDWLEEKYQVKIDDTKSALFSLKQKQKSLIEEIE